MAKKRTNPRANAWANALPNVYNSVAASAITVTHGSAAIKILDLSSTIAALAASDGQRVLIKNAQVKLAFLAESKNGGTSAIMSQRYYLMLADASIAASYVPGAAERNTRTLLDGLVTGDFSFQSISPLVWNMDTEGIDCYPDGTAGKLFLKKGLTINITSWIQKIVDKIGNGVGEDPDVVAAIVSTVQSNSDLTACNYANIEIIYATVSMTPAGFLN